MYDKEELTEQVAKVIQYSQGPKYPQCNGVKQIIDQWESHKKFFIEKMGGLIVELPELVHFEIDDNQKQERLDSFANKVATYYNNRMLADFLYELDVKEFFNNLTEMSYELDDIVIPAKYKVVKAFKFFIDNEALLKDIQIEASQIIQENVVSGYLCLSVHPLDYLSISENIHNWRSCHALDGDYRSGNLNYMVDQSTLVCYLRAERNAVLPRFPDNVLWNSKKWRCLIFLSQDKTMMFVGRPYPFFSKIGLRMIRENLLPSVGLGEWSDYCRDVMYTFLDKYSQTRFHLNNLVPVGNTAVPMKELVKDKSNTFQYNDLLKSTVYEPLRSYRTNDLRTTTTGCTNNNTKFTIGDCCVCPICGKRLIAYSNCMACADCSLKYELNSEENEFESCDYCGNNTWYDEIVELPFSGAHVCMHCYNTQTVQCQCCGAIDLPEAIRVRYDNHHEYRCLCLKCYEEEINNNAS